MEAEVFEAADFSDEEYVATFREFIKDYYSQMFYQAICFLWLEKQLVVRGKRRIGRKFQGRYHDLAWRRFMTLHVGYDAALVSRSSTVSLTSTIAATLFPYFFEKNPLKEPELFQWPYKHVQLDFFQFVYQMSNWKEMLDYAEEMHMPIHHFKNWAVNYALCYNDEQGEDIYKIGANSEKVIYIQRPDRNVARHADSLEKMYESKKAETDSDDTQPSP